MSKIELGDEVRDTVTGFKGVAVARTIWISGCPRINVQPKGVDKDGKIFETNSFDENMLEVVKAKKLKEPDRTKGGPRATLKQF